MKLFFGVLLIVACNDKDDSADGSIISGELEVTGEGLVGSVETYQAYGFNNNGKAVFYFAAKDTATCEEVGEYLSTTNAYDKTPLFGPNTCNISLVLSDYTGEDATYETGNWNAIWSVNCTFGDGSFVYEERDDNDYDYYWSGRLWQGSPSDWNLTVSGGDDSAYTITAEMNGFNGSFIYEGLEIYPATGLVAGTTKAKWCSDLASANILGN